MLPSQPLRGTFLQPCLPAPTPGIDVTPAGSFGPLLRFQPQHDHVLPGHEQVALDTVEPVPERLGVALGPKIRPPVLPEPANDLPDATQCPAVQWPARCLRGSEGLK